MPAVARTAGYATLALAVTAGLAVGTAAVNADRLSAAPTRHPATDAHLARVQASLTHATATEAALAADAAHGRLTGQSVVVVVAPGMPAALVRRTVAALRSAGAAIAAQLQLTTAFVDPQSASLEAALAHQLGVPAGVRVPPGTGAQQSADLLAAGLTLGPARSIAPTGTATVLSGYQTAGLLSVTGPTPRPGTAVLVLVPAAAAAAGIAPLVAAFAASPAGVVVAGPDDGRSGPVAALRTDPLHAVRLSTLDSLDQPAGPAEAALTVAGAVAGRFGNFGLGPGTSAPAPTR